MVGPALLRWLGPARGAALAASAGVIRWSITAVTAWLPAMALVEPLHGLTFALLHLACMQMLSAVAPPALAATAQGIYCGVAVGTMTAIMTLVFGPLYGAFGPRAFWFMALLCAAALPIAFAMRGISFLCIWIDWDPAYASVVAWAHQTAERREADIANQGAHS